MTQKSDEIRVEHLRTGVNDVRPRCDPLPGQLSTSILIAARDQLKEAVEELVEEFSDHHSDPAIKRVTDFANTLKMTADALQKVQQMLDDGVQLGIVRG